MKRFPKQLLIGLLLGSLAFAGAGLDSPQTIPPFGLHVEGAAKGTKLDGVVSIEFYSQGQCPSPNEDLVCADAIVTLRLRQGNTNELKMFVGELTDVLFASPAAVQTAITGTLGTQVALAFFPGKTVTLTLKNVTEFGRIDVASGVTTGSTFILANVQIAAS